jgi:hypothetical protein
MAEKKGDAYGEGPKTRAGLIGVSLVVLGLLWFAWSGWLRPLTDDEKKELKEKERLEVLEKKREEVQRKAAEQKKAAAIARLKAQQAKEAQKK